MATPQITTIAQPLTGDLFVDLATTGFRWLLNADRTIDWSISGGFGTEFWIDPNQTRNIVQTALDNVSYYANVRFNYVGSFSTPTAAAAGGSEINFSGDGANRFFTADNQWARGFFPSGQSEGVYAGAAGDVYLNLRSDANDLPSFEPGTTGYALLLHELGHALGLKHPHDDGGTGRPTFEQLGLGELDKDWATVMSYNDDYDWNLYGFSPATWMPLDVLALQYLYGPNMATNAGDSLFNLNFSNAYLTLWDASGIDTLNFSGMSQGFEIDLPFLQLSNLIPNRLGLAVPLSEAELDSPKTLLWMLGEIENVTGTGFADDIFGNDLRNVLNGGAGNDYIDGDAGQDYIRGDEGNDELWGGADFDDINGNMGNDTASGEAGNDWVVGGKDNDLLFGDDGDDLVYGNLGSDTCHGGAGDDIVRGGQQEDSLTGGSGNDYLSGDRENDTLTGGSGADIFHSHSEAGVDRITDFNRGEGDQIQLLAGSTYTVAQVGADTVVSIGSNGAQLILAGVSMSSLTGNWITA